MISVKSTWLRSAVAFAVLGTAAGCAHRPPAVGAGMAGPAVTAMRPSSENAERLARLFSQRQAARTDGDYVLGKGDLLAIKAYDVEEINEKIRVDGNGTITLPLVNTVQVAGLTVAELQADLNKRVGAFMFDPRVTVFVEEYRAVQVAVLGAVHRPGLVSAMARNSTVLDTISAAGGLTQEAGTRIFFMPAESRQQALAQGLGADAPTAVDAAASKDGIVVDTKELDEQTKHFLFGLPVHDGDVIMVPTSGNFITSGWFNKPGPYPLRSGTTLRGAVATAGGFSFPAKRTHVRIYRIGSNGETEMQDINYERIAALEMPDVFVHEGDVVDVSYSAAKIVPWTIFKGISELVHLGIGTKVAP